MPEYYTIVQVYHIWSNHSSAGGHLDSSCFGAIVNNAAVNIFFLKRIFYFFKKVYLFIYLFIYYFWLRWVFVAVHGLSLVAASRGYTLLQCAGFSLWWLLLLWSIGSRHTGFSSCNTWALEHAGFSSCSGWAQQLWHSGSRVRGLQQLWHVASGVVARELQSAGLVVVAQGLSCSTAYGIFLDQGSNPCPLHWQADS